MEKQLSHSLLKENRQHGSPAFPCAFYQIDFERIKSTLPFFVKHHWQEELEIVHFEKGHYQVEINMQTYQIEQECLCFIGSGELHSIYCEKDYKEQAVVFSPTVLCFDSSDHVQATFLRSILNNEVQFPRFIYKEDAFFDELVFEFKRICHAFSLSCDAATIPSQLHIKASLLNILAILEEHGVLVKSKAVYNQRLESLKTVMFFIQEHYQEKIYISELAKLINMNEQYFCRFFKKGLGKTPIQYLNDYRIQQACILLEHTDQSVTEICMNCGFNNLSHFMKEFKKNMNLTPLQFRKSHFITH